MSSLPMIALAAISAALLKPPFAVAQQTVAARDSIASGKAPAGSPLDRPARLVAHDSRLADALSELTERSGVVVAFSPSVLGADRRIVSCDCLTLTVRQTLDRLLLGTGFWYAAVNGQVMIYRDRAVDDVPERGLTYQPPTQLALRSDLLAHVRLTRLVDVREAQQGGTVAGVVVDRRSLPIANARVTVAGTSSQSTTDAAGRFRLANLSGGDVTLSVTAIGYRPLTQVVRVGEAAARLAMTEVAIDLDEIVVTGTPGGTEKRALGNSISQIKATEVTEVAAISDVAQLINGRAPGVVVQPGTGAVGSGPQIRIRGASSITLFRNQPLLYVDGIRVDNRTGAGPAAEFPAVGGGIVSRLSDFNPEDIESVEIIKGPAAAALYGTEASAGVIQIITKKGTIGGRPQVGVTLRHGASWFMDAENRWPTLYARDATTGQPIEWNAVRAEKARGTPMLGTGHQQAYGLNVSGGTERLRYYLGADVGKENGIEPLNSLFRLSGRSNVDVVLSDKVDASVNLGLVTSTLNLPSESTRGMWAAMDFGNPRAINTPTRGFGAPPELWWQASENRGATNRFTAGVKLQHRPLAWLTQRLAVGMDLVNDDNYALQRNIASDPYLGQFTQTGGPLGTKWAKRERTVTNTLDYGATATARVTGGLTSSTSAGLQYYRNYFSFANARGQGFPDFSVESISAATTTSASDGFVENTTVGVYVQQQLGWHNRLFLTAALRADDNSAFGKSFNLVSYPKVSASWVVSEEPFWPFRFVDAFKLRAAYGQSGQQPQAFAAVSTYSSVSGQTGVPGLAYSTLGNPNLGPERGKEIEVGFEAGLFGDRVGLEFTYYNTRTEDAILSVPTIPSQGGFATTRFENLGTIQNRGIEALVRARVLDGRSVAWDLSANVSRNNNKVLRLAAGRDQVVGGGGIGQVLKHSEGFPAFSFFTRRVVSANVGADGIARNVLCDGGAAANNQPVDCATAPYQFSGPAMPKIEGAVSSTVTLFGRLRLYGLVDFKTGHKLWNQSAFIRCLSSICRELVFPSEYDPKLIGAIQTPATRLDVWVKDAAFAKLRELSASYALPTKWARSFGASRAAVTLAGRNLHTWTSWAGVDPEVFYYPALGFGDEYFFFLRNSTPQLAQFVATVNLTF